MSIHRPEPPKRDEESWAAGREATGSTSASHDLKRDGDIIVALRKGESSAYEAFIDRFHRILIDYARRAGVQGADRDEFVSDLLEDVALRFMAPGTPLPQNPRMYLIAAFRNKFLNQKRGRKRRDRVVSEAVRDAAADCDYANDGDVVAACSEGMVRASRGPGWESAPLPRALQQLSTRLSESLDDDDRRLLVAVAENVPQREIAAWLGVSHVAARKRLERLRARLMDASMHYANSLQPDDARELNRFLRRCRARIGANLVVGSSDDPLARGA